MDAYPLSRVMLVMAHPDDMEFIAGGTVARWAREGKEIAYVCCTDGDKGGLTPEQTPERMAPVRREEQREAVRRLGAREVVFLGYADSTLEPSLALRRDLVAQIRRLRPDILVCHDPTRRWGSKDYIQHPDHLAAGEAALAAAFPAAGMPYVYPDIGPAPHRVREIWLCGPAEPDTWVDIGPTLDVKIEGLRAHASQVDGLDVDKLLRDWARGTAAGSPEPMEFAESFRRFFPFH